jgi:hypothetical protein
MQNIDIYYESIRQVYEQILKWPERKQPLHEKIIDGIVGIVGFLFALSTIPIIPAIFVVIGSQVGLSWGAITMTGATLGTFLIVWGMAFVVGLLLFVLVLWVNSKIDSHAEKPIGPPQTLSPEQLTFIAIYKAYKELKVFFVSHVEQHVHSSYQALKRALASKRDYREYVAYRELREREMIQRSRTEQIQLGDEEDEVEVLFPHDLSTDNGKRLSPSFPRQVEIARAFLQTFEKYAWFQLDPDTKGTLQALISFSEKIPYRLKQKEDLPAVLSILENLSKFTYAYLPEHKTYMESAVLEKLQTEGTKCLHQFAKQVNDLTPYSRPERKKESQKELSPTIQEKIRNVFYGNLFFRFTVWFVLILALTTGAVSIINQRVILTPDTMATLVIGTSVASAAALAGFLPRSKEPK